MQSYIEVNKSITVGNLEQLRTSDFRNAIMLRCKDEFQFIKGYIKVEDYILDLGVRDGAFLETLKDNRYINLFGVDISEEAVQLCVSRGYNVGVDDVHDLKVEDGAYHFVSIIHTLEHTIDPAKVLNEIHRVLRPNGCVFIEIPLQKNEAPELGGHFSVFNTESQLLNILRDKFTVLKMDKQPGASKKPGFRVVAQRK